MSDRNTSRRQPLWDCCSSCNCLAWITHNRLCLGGEVCLIWIGRWGQKMKGGSITSYKRCQRSKGLKAGSNIIMIMSLPRTKTGVCTDCRLWLCTKTMLLNSSTDQYSYTRAVAPSKPSGASTSGPQILSRFVDPEYRTGQSR